MTWAHSTLTLKSQAIKMWAERGHRRASGYDKTIKWQTTWPPWQAPGRKWGSDLLGLDLASGEDRVPNLSPGRWGCGRGRTSENCTLKQCLVNWVSWTPNNAAAHNPRNVQSSLAGAIIESYKVSPVAN